MTLQATTTTNLLTRSHHQQLRTQLLKSEAVKSGGPETTQLEPGKARLPITSSSIKPVTKVTAENPLDRHNRLFEPGQSTEPSEFKKTIFKIILLQIKLLIAIVRFLNTTCLQFYYLVYYYLERLKHSRRKNRLVGLQNATGDSSLSACGGDCKSLTSTFVDDQSKDSLFSPTESSLFQKTNSSLNSSRPPNTFSLSVNSSHSSLPANPTYAQENNFKIPDLVHVPSHVCVIFNEFGVKHDYDLFECIGKVMSANDVKMLSFYSFKSAFK